jgi:hypothetical protein
MPVIDQLEVVGIDHQHRQRSVVSLHPRKFGFQRPKKLPSIRKPRQLIYIGKFAQLLCCANEAGNVVKCHQAAAIWQRFAPELQDATIAQTKPTFALADVVLNRARGGDVEASSAPVLDDVRKVVSASIGQLGQFPHLIEGTVDELSLEVLVQHDEARFDLIQY